MTTATRKPAGSFVRLDTKVRDQLRAHCTARGLVMSTLVSNVLSEYLNQAAGAGSNGRRSKPKRKSKPRR